MTTWILLRGLTRESGHWGVFARDFATALANARVVTLDLPGNGTLHRKRSPATVERLVEDCRLQLERRNVSPPFSVLAMSLGAMAAVAWASAYPAELQRCVLINTSLRPFCPFYWRLRPANYLALARVFLATEAGKRERLILQMTSARIAENAAVVGDWTTILHEHPVSRANALRQLCAAVRYRAPNARPRAELLMLASRDDALVDVRCSRRVARAWQVQLAEHPSAGHDLPLDDPAWVIEQVRAWL
jgi:pimeloyl-ACP methyl ester carboxylesterase